MLDLSLQNRRAALPPQSNNTRLASSHQGACLTTCSGLMWQRQNSASCTSQPPFNDMILPSNDCQISTHATTKKLLRLNPNRLFLHTCHHKNMIKNPLSRALTTQGPAPQAASPYQGTRPPLRLCPHAPTTLSPTVLQQQPSHIRGESFGL